MSNTLKKIANYFSPANKKLKEAKKIVPLINSKEQEFSQFTHQDILNKTIELRNRYKSGESLHNLLVEAFALVREGAKRVLYQRPYDVQMIGAFILHNRMIAEMYTGEGKTLVAVIAAYLNGLTEKGVQIVTVNDYLAKRDSEENGKILKYLGLTVGLIQENMERNAKREAYKKDVTYVSNHEIAFDYLRDNMELYYENQVMIDRINFCIVDEADSVLIDEASTPLIISGPGPKSSGLYEKLTPMVKKLNPTEHLEFDEFRTRADLTESGMDFIEDELVKIGLLEANENQLSSDEEIADLLVKDYINLMVNLIFLHSLQKAPLTHTTGVNEYFDELLGLDKKNEDLIAITTKLQNSYFKLVQWHIKPYQDENDEEINLFKTLLPIINSMKPFVHFNYIYKTDNKERNLTPLDLEKYLTNRFIPLDFIRIDINMKGWTFIRDKSQEQKILAMEGMKEFWKIGKFEYKTSRDTLHRINHRLYEPKNILMNHYIHQIIKANFIMKLDIDYIISKSNEIVIIDQHTGRLGFGRRFSDGLHQALEAKENVEIKDENVTVASTTYQSFFQLFQLAGMTGTAKESEEEFIDVYNLEVVSIPTNKPSQKKIFKDILFFKNEDRLEKINEIVQEKYDKGQPILIITLTVNDSEIISKSLNKKKIPHCLLNAKNHEEEANIIRDAGKFNSVTVATDIAGRGTDVQLGGSRSHIIATAQEHNSSKETIDQLVKNLEEEKLKISNIGGLCVLCIGRHESERMDNQASGRCGRQGEPGEVRFLLSLEDELLQNSMSNSSVQQWSLSEILDSDENYASGYLVETWINTIQKSKGALNYESRKNLFRYDKIIDIQRKILYKMRNNLLRINEVYFNFNAIEELKKKSFFFEIIEKVIDNISEIILFNIDYTSKESIEKAKANFYKIFNLNNEIIVDNNEIIDLDNIVSKQFINKIKNIYYKRLQEEIGSGSSSVIARKIKNNFINSFDKTMEKYLQAISDSKDASYLSSYAQKDPLNEFNKRMMGILGDFFLEWQQMILESIFYVKHYDDPMNIHNNHKDFNTESIILDNSQGFHSKDLLKNLNTNNQDVSLEQLEEFLKNNEQFLQNIKNYNESHEDENERMKLKNEINNLFLDHLSNFGTIEYVDDNNDQHRIDYRDYNGEEVLQTLKSLSEYMDLEQLKELKQELLDKIHNLRSEITVDSEEYENTVYNEFQEVANVENIITNLQQIIKTFSSSKWDQIQKHLVDEINNLDIDSEEWDWDYEWEDEMEDVLDDIEEMAYNVEPEEWKKIKENLIDKIEDISFEDVSLDTDDDK